MKNKLFTLLFAAAAALNAGCSSDSADTTPDQSGVRVKFLADVVGQDQTRAIIDVGNDAFTGVWENGDAMCVLPTIPGGSSPAGPYKFTYNSGEFAFEGTLPSLNIGKWKYLAFHPHADVSGTVASVPFGNLRTQRGNLFNSSYDALVADELVFQTALPGEDEDGNVVKFNLNRLTSILYFKVDGAISDPVKYLLLTSKEPTQPLSAASLDFDVALGAAATAALSVEGQSKTIVIDYGNNAPLASAVEGFFNVPAGNYNELTLNVITTTDKIGTATIVRNDPTKPFEPGKLYKKEITAMQFADVALPSFDWPGEDIDAVHEITLDELSALTYSAAINITAPGAIAGLTVDIESDVLNGIGVTTLDLFNSTEIPGLQIPYDALGLNSGAKVQYAKSVVFDITELVPLIMALPGVQPGSLHTFAVTVTDLAGQSTVQALTFQAPGGATPKAVYNNDADLWANTATMTISNIPYNGGIKPTLKYRIKGETVWQMADVAIIPGLDGEFIATIAPQWNLGNNSNTTTPATTYWPNPKTGVFATHTYEYELVVDGDMVDSGEFTPDNNGGQIITDGNMENGALNCFNSTGTGSFWNSGNNSLSATLCAQSTYKGMQGSYCAYLTARQPVLFVKLAAGNLFVGDFSLSGTTGTVKFGKKYDWKARPTAMSVLVHAKIGNVNQNQHSGPLATGTPDKARIYVAIVDWSAQHAVASGSTAPKGTWDPATMTSVAEGNIIGYGSVFIEGTTAGDSMVRVEIPIQYYDKITKPNGNYTLAISCSTSAYGDFMNGCTTSVMYLDDFQWVY